MLFDRERFVREIVADQKIVASRFEKKDFCYVFLTHFYQHIFDMNSSFVTAEMANFMACKVT